MPQVDVQINGKSYRIACEDGQEPRIAKLAAMVDAHVGDIVEQAGQIGDSRLLVMASLLIADELVDLRETALEGDDGTDADPDVGDLDPEAEERLALAVESLAERVENIAAALEGA